MSAFLDKLATNVVNKRKRDEEELQENKRKIQAETMKWIDQTFQKDGKMHNYIENELIEASKRGFTNRDFSFIPSRSGLSENLTRDMLVQWDKTLSSYLKNIIKELIGECIVCVHPRSVDTRTLDLYFTWVKETKVKEKERADLIHAK